MPVTRIRSFFVGRTGGRPLRTRVARVASWAPDGGAWWLPMTVMLRTVYVSRRIYDPRPAERADKPLAQCGGFCNGLTDRLRLDTLRKQIVTGFTDLKTHC